PDPARRYQRAGDLAEDLRALLHDLPLRHAPELSWAERLRKWARRHPRLTSSGTVAAAALLLLAGTLAGAASLYLAARHQLAAPKGELPPARDRGRKQRFEAGTVRALCLVHPTDDLDAHVRQGRAACEETLGLYGVLDRDDWRGQPAWARLAGDDR